MHLQCQQNESVPQQSIRVSNYLPNEDIRILQLGAIFQADVLSHIVHVVDETVQQRDKGDRADTNHVLLHVVYPIATSRRQTEVGQEHGQTPEIFPPEWLGYLELLDFQDEDVQTIQDVGGQFDQHYKEQQVVEENAVF